MTFLSHGQDADTVEPLEICTLVVDFLKLLMSFLDRHLMLMFFESFDDLESLELFDSDHWISLCLNHNLTPDFHVLPKIYYQNIYM